MNLCLLVLALIAQIMIYGSVATEAELWGISRPARNRGSMKVQDEIERVSGKSDRFDGMPMGTSPLSSEEDEKKESAESSARSSANGALRLVSSDGRGYRIDTAVILEAGVSTVLKDALESEPGSSVRVPNIPSNILSGMVTLLEELAAQLNGIRSNARNCSSGSSATEAKIVAQMQDIIASVIPVPHLVGPRNERGVFVDKNDRYSLGDLPDYLNAAAAIGSPYLANALARRIANLTHDLPRTKKSTGFGASGRESAVVIDGGMDQYIARRLLTKISDQSLLNMIIKQYYLRGYSPRMGKHKKADLHYYTKGIAQVFGVDEPRISAGELADYLRCGLVDL